jgi:hypothetical protein
MAETRTAVRGYGEQAMACLEEDEKAVPVETMKQRLDQALIALINMRDELIQARRAGQDDSDWLPRTNGIISTLYGTEFPVGGIKMKRIEEARRALRDLLKSDA